MKYILIYLSALSLILETGISFANFSGMSMTESPVESVETMVDQVLVDSKLEKKMSANRKDYKKLREALIKGSLRDNDVLRNIVKARDDLLQRPDEYTYTQDYLKSTAQEFGYNEQIVTSVQ